MATLLLFLWIAPMVVTAIVARRKGYRLLLWIPLALLFSVLALCLIALLPPKGVLARRARRAARAWREEGQEDDETNLIELGRAG
jgi:hypothetical protein